MIRQRLSLIYITIFVWASMLFGLLVINIYLVPLEFPGGNPVLTGVLKVVISFLLSVLWLWIWRRMIVMMFWRAIREQ